MFKNYFTIAFRTIRKNKIFSAINVMGLSIGISASLAIYLLVNYHLNFDKFEKEGDRIYRVVSEFTFSGESYKNSGVMGPMGNAVRQELTGIEYAVPFYTWDGDTKVTVPDANKQVPAEFKKQTGIIFADSAFTKMIGYQWLAGNAQKALLGPYQVVLSAANAKLYFPGLNADQVIGKTLYLNDSVLTTVSGVVKDTPFNTDFTFKTFVSRATLEQTSLKPRSHDSWGNTNGASQLYIKLAPGSTVAQVQSRLASLYKKHYKGDVQDHSTTKFALQPLSDLHFNAEFGGYDLPLANKPTLLGLLAIAAFLLLLGCINFINLTTAHAAQRAKEIGIRKTMGSTKRQLILQFLSETFLLTLIATLFSVLLTPLVLKAFAGFIPEGLHFSLISQPGVILFLLALMLVVTLLSGLYPALVLSGFKPVLVLKNQAYTNTSKTRNAWLRKSLTVSQFAIAQVFIMATILVSKQITFSLNKDQGFKKEAILYFNTNYYDTVPSHKTVLLEKIKAMPEVAMVSLCNNPPSSISTWSGTMKYMKGKQQVETDVQQKYGDTNYIKLYGLKLIAGTNLGASDTTNSFLINETYSKILGFKQPSDAIGKNLEWSEKKLPIVGVVADFNQRSLHEPIKPLAIGTWLNTQRNFSIALQPLNEAGTNWKTAIEKIKKAYLEIYPKDEFDFSFFNEDIAKYYVEEQHISSLLKWATGLAVFISCLGLLGLVIYTTTQRTKEIGVRKVLGASVVQIVRIITNEFMLLIIIAFIIAAPLAWMGMHKWLENFAYRTAISWWIFGMGGVIMIVIALCTLSFQTIRAATANPVKSLRTE
jgi:predicted permease